MGHPDIHSFKLKSLVFRNAQPHPVIVNIAVYSPQGFEFFQLINDILMADITCMPYLVAGFKVMKNPLVEPAVGI
jgi:hypothetical protein